MPSFTESAVVCASQDGCTALCPLHDEPSDCYVIGHTTRDTAGHIAYMEAEHKAVAVLIQAMNRGTIRGAKPHTAFMALRDRHAAVEAYRNERG